MKSKLGWFLALWLLVPVCSTGMGFLAMANQQLQESETESESTQEGREEATSHCRRGKPRSDLLHADHEQFLPPIPPQTTGTRLSAQTLAGCEHAGRNGIGTALRI